MFKARILNVGALLFVLMLISVFAVSAAVECHLVSFTTQASGSVVQKGGHVHDTATITISDPARLHVGLNFFLCGPTSGITPCSTGGVALATVSVDQTTTGFNQVVTIASPDYQPTVAGTYCYRVAQPTSLLGNQVTLSTISWPHIGGQTNPDTTSECFTVSNTTAVTLSSFSASAGAADAELYLGLGFAGVLAIVLAGCCFLRKTSFH
jgi:hypothetical protein